MQKQKAVWYNLASHALKLPLVILVTGFSLICINWLMPPKVTSAWPHLFYGINIVSYLLLLLSFISFVYSLITTAINAYEIYFLKKSHNTITRIITLSKNGLKIIFTLLAFNIITETIDLKPQYINIIHDLIIVIIIAAVTWILLQLLFLAEDIIRNKYIALYTKIHIFKNIGIIIIITLAIAASLMVFDKVRNIGISLLASAGFLTGILALAAQKTLGSIFAGFQLFLSQTIKIGDAVFVENEFGYIEAITLSYVVIKIWDARRLILPVSYFIEKPFQNWSRDKEGLIGTIKLHVDYTLPIEPIRNELDNILQQTQRWNGRVSKLIVNDCKENILELLILVSAADAGILGDLRNEVREKLLAYISINYSQSLPKLRITAN